MHSFPVGSRFMCHIFGWSIWAIATVISANRPCVSSYMASALAGRVARTGLGLANAGACVLSLLIGAPATALAEPREMSAEARAVFDQAKGKLVQLRVLQKATGARTGTGTGFFASADGLVLTN